MSLRERLKPYNLETPSELAKALGSTQAWASMLLNGYSFGLRVAKKLSKVTGVPWQEIYTWQDADEKNNPPGGGHA